MNLIGYTRRIVPAFALCVAWLHAIADPVSDAKEISERISRHKVDALRRDPVEVYQEIERLRTGQAAKVKAGAALMSLALDPDNQKMTGYTLALRDRRQAGEGVPAFLYAMVNGQVCVAVDAAGSDQDLSKKCWLDSLESFKLASNARIPAASFNVARMYELGWGVLPSKLAAADWYSKAAEQHWQAGSRDDALTAVEAALNAEPTHPSALRLKRAMLK